MKHLEYIDDYFKGAQTAPLNKQFEQRLLEDPEFASAVSFYLSTQKLLQQTVREEKIARFRKLYNEAPATPVVALQPKRRRWYYMAAAAAILAIVLSVTFLSGDSKQQLADRYIKQELNELSVSMSGGVDSIELVRSLYNKGEYARALHISEALIGRNATNVQALEYAGIANLRLQQYDKALAWFKQMAARGGYSNKGTFYQALTLIKRDKPGDIANARTLLEQVVKEDLEGREFAREWLAKW